jgi:hypothetical protein
MELGHIVGCLWLPRDMDSHDAWEHSGIALPPCVRSTQCWALVASPGFLTHNHHDHCGVIGEVCGMWGYKIWVLAFPKKPMDTANVAKWKKRLENIVAAEAPEVIQLFHLYAVVIGPGTEM